MNKIDQVAKTYFAVEPFSLEKDFMDNPLMACIKLARYKFVAKMLSKNDVVVDLGCGNGYSSYFFSKFFPTSLPNSAVIITITLYRKNIFCRG